MIAECTYTKLSDAPYAGSGKSSMEAGCEGIEMFCPGADPSSVSGNSGVAMGDWLKGETLGRASRSSPS